LEAELPGVLEEARSAVQVAAHANGANLPATTRAFVLAAQYHAPQRALACALAGRRRVELATKLSRSKGKRARRAARAFQAAAAGPSYAFMLAAPIGPFELSDTVMSTQLRLRFSEPVLMPKSTRCVTVSGEKPRTCTLYNVADGDADAHALSCKSGGYGIHGHDYTGARLGSLSSGWGMQIATPWRAFLVNSGAMKLDLGAYAAGFGRIPLVTDLTRHFGATVAQLEKAEVAKQAKYAGRFAIPVTLLGFAWNELGEVGPQACEVASLLVAAGSRNGAGHPADLAAEFWATFSCANAQVNTARLAHFAGLSGDRSAHAPRKSNVLVAGRARVTGAAYRLFVSSRPRRGPFRLVEMPPARKPRAAPTQQPRAAAATKRRAPAVDSGDSTPTVQQRKAAFPAAAAHTPTGARTAMRPVAPAPGGASAPPPTLPGPASGAPRASSPTPPPPPPPPPHANVVLRARAAERVMTDDDDVLS
jgi:hypothetical protein